MFLCILVCQFHASNLVWETKTPISIFYEGLPTSERQDDSEALKFFNSLKESEQHNYVKWVYSEKTEQAKIDRIAKTLTKLSKHQKFTDK